MHVLIVNFKLRGITEDEYAQAAEHKFASLFRDMPGLISKLWLKNDATNTYGGVYIWRDRQAIEAYRQSEIFAELAANPHFTDVTCTDFGVLESPTRITRGLAAATA
jgi:heme-degrading monooxygenase HmoA